MSSVACTIFINIRGIKFGIRYKATLAMNKRADPRAKRRASEQMNGVLIIGRTNFAERLIGNAWYQHDFNSAIIIIF